MFAPLIVAAAVAAQPPADPVPVVRLTVTPAAAPVPVLKYDLLPPARDKTPGNAVVMYLRGALKLPAPPSDPEERKEWEERRDRWRDAPPGELPLAEVRAEFKPYQTSFHAAEVGARFTRCEWDPPPNATIMAFNTGLGELQQVRQLVGVLVLRAKVELAGDDFNAASRTLQTGLQIGKHAGEGPTLLSMLAGIGMTELTFRGVHDWIDRPGSPNLYWALSTLPRPLIDPRVAMDGELAQIENTMPAFRDLARGPLSNAEAWAAVRAMFDTWANAADLPPKAPKGVARFADGMFWAGDVAYHYPSSLRFLEGRRYPRVREMPPVQVVFLATRERLQEMKDLLMNEFRVPLPERTARAGVAEDWLRDYGRENRNDFLVAVGSNFIPGVVRVHRALIQSERRVAMLRVVEALRMHAAANSGRFPDALADVKIVTIPDDPATGKPFAYSRSGDTATLDAPPPKNEPPSPTNTLKYEITLRK